MTDGKKTVIDRGVVADHEDVKRASVTVKFYEMAGHIEARYSSWEGPPNMDEDSKRKFVFARALRNLFRRVLSLEADHLLTLTYAANVEELAISREHLRAFCKAVRRKIPKWLFVAVAERQKRGAVHWHLAVKGYQQVELLRALWLNVVNVAGGGNIDVKYFKGDAPRDIARYVAKYLGKGFGELGRYGQHYYTSRGLLGSEEVFKVYGMTMDQVDDWIRQQFEDRGKPLESSYWQEPYREIGGAVGVIPSR